MLREFRDHELFEVRGAPHHCVSPVQPDPSGSRAPPSRCDRCYTPSFLVHAAHFIVLRHDVLQLRASDDSSASPAMYTTSHTSLLPSTGTDGCHELCLLHLSDLNRVRHAVIELTAEQQILVSSDLTSQCLGLIVSLNETLGIICLLSPTCSDSSSVIISSIIEMTLMIRRSGIVQRADHRPSVTSFWTSRSFALTIMLTSPRCS